MRTFPSIIGLVILAVLALLSIAFSDDKKSSYTNRFAFGKILQEAQR